MMDVRELLQAKENDLARVRKEIHALRVAAPLLSEDDEEQVSEPTDDEAEADLKAENSETGAHEEPVPEGNEIFSRAMPPKQSRLRNWLGLAAGE